MQKILDLIGIGIGPFNLGMAALCDGIPTLKSLFIDQKNEFDWHPGMMLEGTKLQVPFHADLVTLANPQSPYSFLCYLKARQRLFRFTIREEYFPLRKEYNDYCQWVCGQLDNLLFGYRCEAIHKEEAWDCYRIEVKEVATGQIKTYFAKHIVIGVGTLPYLPSFIDKSHPHILHAAYYLNQKERIKQQQSITIIGSGQSAAEIFDDLLATAVSEDKELLWCTRSARLFPMDYSKFALEMTSPDYIDHFYALSEESKAQTLKSQTDLYKGINRSLISHIYDKLYAASLEENGLGKIQLRPNCRLENVVSSEEKLQCHFLQTEMGQAFTHPTDILILATGYQSTIPSFLQPIASQIHWDAQGRYQVHRAYCIDDAQSIFVQNAELHTHGFNAPDLGMGPYRNAVILNTILGYEHFELEKNVPFQSFG